MFCHLCAFLQRLCFVVDQSLECGVIRAISRLNLLNHMVGENTSTTLIACLFADNVFFLLLLGDYDERLRITQKEHRTTSARVRVCFSVSFSVSAFRGFCAHTNTHALICLT